MKRATATVCACCLAALAQTAAGRRRADHARLARTSPGPAPPPLAGGQQLSSEPGEVRVPGSLDNAEAVRVGLAQDGTPVSVVVVQRMSIRGLGDFRFVVPAPAVDAAPAVGSQSLPGLRQAGIVWQGFSPGTRLLGARITLRPTRAVAGLPLRVSVERRSGVTRVQAREPHGQAVRGHARLGSPAGAPGRARTHPAGARPRARRRTAAPDRPRAGAGAADRAADRRRSTPRSTSRGRSRSPAAGRPGSTTTLGGAYPRSRVVALRGDGRADDRPRRGLRARPAQAAADRSTSWPRPPTRCSRCRRRSPARPSRCSSSSTSPRRSPAARARLHTATRRHGPPPPRPAPSGGDDGLSALVLALIAIGGLAVLGGLTVLWAHL